ncbi:MAG: DegV family protein [Clostridia bacterium]|jgi:DegV family protein with EDD domain|nr:DegV family protein [Clostridia bacterium]MBO7504503.1 DegV family protein [Clostridia bacterium]MBP5665344.1 DegV family protein [Clostridia bacterium]
MLILFTDSDTDMTPEMCAEYGYNLISMPYSVDGKTIYPYVDFKEFDSRAFYDGLRGGWLPNTSAISVDQYIEYFEPHFAAGNDIFYVHFSRAMTITFDNMDEALKILKEKYPERKFYEVDTKGITTISCAIVRAIGELFKAGKTPEEVLEWASVEVDKHAMYFFADDLKFFKHSGRVSGIAGTMGTLLGIRPIIHMSGEGKMVSVGKEKGRPKAIARLLAYMDELGDDITGHPVYIGHTDAPELVEELATALREKYGDALNLRVVVVNPTAGSHCGPNGIGVCFHAIHR